jgi:hypothetical protein
METAADPPGEAIGARNCPTFRLDAGAASKIPSVSAIFLHLVLISLFGRCGGHCHGPRLSTDLDPWLALLGMLAKPNVRANHFHSRTFELAKSRAVSSSRTTLGNGSGISSGSGLRQRLPKRVSHCKAKLGAFPPAAPLPSRK